MSRAPQNPFASFLVAASAGSGKTYQLSRRFLHLVGAGAAPESILTVTFTKKAAGEMRQRILEEAARLSVSEAAQAAFAAESAAFHAEAAQRGFAPPPPRTPLAVGRRILAASQTLAVTTIDSLFLDWLRKFPDESGPLPGDAEPPLASPFQLLDPDKERELSALAWTATCRLLARALERGDTDATALLEALPDLDLRGAAHRVKGLDRFASYLWHAERAGGRARAFHPLEIPPESAGLEGLAAEDLVQGLSAELLEIAAAVADDTRRSEWQAAIVDKNLDLLSATGMLTATYTISGRFIRGKKREALHGPVQTVEDRLCAWINVRRLAALNRQGDAQYALGQTYRSLRAALKQKRGLAEFGDLAKSAFRLFHGDAGLGVRFLLARTTRHLLLDEFQDTSRLQWAIFGEMAATLLAGDGVEGQGDAAALPPSVFIVGDAKQSIYGFREADPTVMDAAGDALGERLTPLPLTDSYRTAQVVLDFVNAVFPDFPAHNTATIDGKPVVPDVGRVEVLPLAEADEGAGKPDDGAAEAQEAEQLAVRLADALAGRTPHPVQDKATGGFRALTPGDCAILYRSTTKADAYESALRRRGIPCRREEAHGFFARPEIQDATALLRFAALPADLVALATVLRSPFGGVSDAALLAVLRVTSAVAAADRPMAVLDALRSSAVATAPHETLCKALTSLVQDAGHLLPHALLARTLARLGAFAAYGRPELYRDVAPDVARSTEAPQAVHNLTRFLEILLSLEDEGLTTLPALLRRLEALAERDDVAGAAVGHDAVTLMTIHKAKGLEFPFVAVVDTGRPWGRRDLYWIATEDDDGRPALTYVGRASDRPIGDARLDTLIERAGETITAECQRLLYVALTRARQYLLVTGHRTAMRQGLDGSKPHAQLSAAFAARADWNSGDLAIATKTAPTAERAPAALSIRAVPNLPREIRLASPSKHGAKSRPATLVALPWSERDDPLEERRLATAIGTALHAAMDAHLCERAFDAEAALTRLLRDSSQRRIVNEALALLERTRADACWTTWKRDGAAFETELDLVHQLDAATIVRGTLDLLVTHANGDVLIVDYKTTRFAAPPADDQLTFFAAARGYADQLATYAAAVRALRPGARVTSALYFMSLARLVHV